MRKYLPQFEYIEPESLPQTLTMLSSLEGRDGQVLAGGTDLVTSMREKGLRPSYVLALRNVSKDLDYVEFDAESHMLRVGALTTIHSIETSSILKRCFYPLTEAACELGSYQVKNRATVGGNICNASPAADMVPSLMVLESELLLISSNGGRMVPVEKFFVGPGKSVIGKSELLKEIQVKEPVGSFGASFLKIARKMTGCAIVNVATFVKLNGRTVEEVRVALGSVAPVPVRARTVEREVKGRGVDDLDMVGISSTVEKDISPIDDVRASLDYRKHLARVLVERSLGISIRRAMGE
jgi:carbon-monoxide dehydrogenase medium subunit